jgi:hypothetical protein
MVNKKLLNPQPVTRNPILRFTHYALRPTHNAQPTTNFGANAPPTHKFHALRFTHHALRITSHAHFSKIANFAVKSVKSRTINHAPDGYQMTTEVVII